MASAMDIRLEDISVISELERMGWAYEPISDNELKVCCPAHEEKRPSCTLNTEKRMFNCKVPSCKASGDFISFMTLALKTTRRAVIEELAGRYGGVEGAKLVDHEAVERYHQSIWTQKARLLRGELHKRGLTDEDIRRYRIGFDGDRVTIPIPNASGAYVNVRKYLPGAPTADKMKNMRGHGKIRLYPVSQLSYSTVVVTGGECKAIVTASRMNKFDIGAITATAGEGNWLPEFNREFRGKRVFVLMDVDEAGRRAAEAIAARLSGEAEWVGIATLPLDRDKYPHGDVNDFFGAEKKSADDLMTVLDAAKRWEPLALADKEVAPTEAEVIHLSQVTHASRTGKRVKTRGVVASMDATPYLVPKKVCCTCDRSAEFCTICPVFARTPDEDTGSVSLDVHPESPAILQMVAAPKGAQRDAIRDALRIPVCKQVTFKITDYYNVQDVRVTPQLSIASRAAEHIEQAALVIAHDIETNTSYDFEGRCYPHPRNQQAVVLASKAVAADDALSAFKPSAAELDPLRVFQPATWTTEGLKATLDSVYEDFESNVTRIFKRRDLHFVIDLIYHTPLLINVDGRRVKGWGEALICGDSSQGKSETALRIIDHYGLGERVECKNATRAGLLGGLKEMGNRFFVSWGVIPTHDKRIVFLEELKGASTEVIAELTDMRSSGVAMISKIEKMKTHARTRLVAISNPRSDRSLSTYNFGVEVIKELIGSLEDIRRFDIALLVAASQVDPRELNELIQHRPVVEHRFTSALCQRLVLWAWTREEHQVVFQSDADKALMDGSVQLCAEFTEAIPLVDRGTIRQKLSRLAAALACRTFSCDETMQQVLVRPCHVQYVVEFIRRTYSDAVFGYKDFSAAMRIADDLKDPDEIKKKIAALPHPVDFIDQVLYTNDIELRDLCDWTAFDRGDGIELMSFLVRKHALQRNQRAYRKTSAFIAFLKQLKESGSIKARPNYIKDRF